MQRHFIMIGLGLMGIGVITSPLRKIPLPHEVAATSEDATTGSIEPSEFDGIVSKVDREFEPMWLKAGLTPAPAANQLQIARRLSLALVGTIPSLEEIRSFEALPESTRLDWWLDHLLQDRRSSDYLAERFARAYVGTENGPFIVFRRRRFVSWLSDQIHHNVPYDQLVRELISARGLWTDHPATNFATVTMGTNGEDRPDEARLAARTTRAFLGVRLDCVQCHDDHLGGDWKQSDFHQLAAFFSPASSSPLGIQDTKREYKYTYLHSTDPVTVEACVPFARSLAGFDSASEKGRPSASKASTGETSTGDVTTRSSEDEEGVEEGSETARENELLTRRERLASWVTHPENKAFSRATVNRVWAIVFGRPLLEPIDSIPLTGPFPPAMQILAEDFVEHGYDLRRLIQVIARSRPFHVDSCAPHTLTSDHEQMWASFPLTRLRPEQVAGAIVQSSSLMTIDSQSHILQRIAAAGQLGDFLKRFGDLGEDEFADFGSATIPQRLMMLNGQLVHERTKEDLLANAATRIASQSVNDASAIEAAYLITLSRRPTFEEQAHFEERLAAQEDDRADRMADVVWTLLNSSEFCWNH